MAPYPAFLPALAALTGLLLLGEKKIGQDTVDCPAVCHAGIGWSDIQSQPESQSENR